MRCMRRVRGVHICGGCEQNRAERSGAERNRRRNGTHGAANERAAEKRELTAAQGRSMFIGASLSLKSLCCLRDGVRSDCPPSPSPPSRGSIGEASVGEGRRIREGHRLRKGTGRSELDAVGRTRARRRAVRRGALEEIYLPRESCGREIESRESDKPTTVGAHPPHYAHRSRDFSVPRETAACRSVAPSRGGKTGPPSPLPTLHVELIIITYSF